MISGSLFSPAFAEPMLWARCGGSHPGCWDRSGIILAEGSKAETACVENLPQPPLQDRGFQGPYQVPGK